MRDALPTQHGRKLPSIGKTWYCGFLTSDKEGKDKTIKLKTC